MLRTRFRALKPKLRVIAILPINFYRRIIQAPGVGRQAADKRDIRARPNAGQSEKLTIFGREADPM
jgi:hypothetical protein